MVGIISVRVAGRWLFGEIALSPIDLEIPSAAAAGQAARLPARGKRSPLAAARTDGVAGPFPGHADRPCGTGHDGPASRGCSDNLKEVVRDRLRFTPDINNRLEIPDGGDSVPGTPAQGAIHVRRQPRPLNSGHATSLWAAARDPRGTIRPTPLRTFQCSEGTVSRLVDAGAAPVRGSSGKPRIASTLPACGPPLGGVGRRSTCGAGSRRSEGRPRAPGAERY